MACNAICSPHGQCERGSSQACSRKCSQSQSSMCLLSDHASFIAIAPFVKAWQGVPTHAGGLASNLTIDLLRLCRRRLELFERSGLALSWFPAHKLFAKMHHAVASASCTLAKRAHVRLCHSLLSDDDSARTILCVVFVARFSKLGAATIITASIRARSVGLTIVKDQAMC